MSAMVIILNAPFSVGDLSPGVTYPHVYITTLYLNGPQMTMVLTYEYGTFSNTWRPAPLAPSQQLSLGIDQLMPFFTTPPSDPNEPLWNQVEALMYAQIQATDPRTAGKIEGVS